MKTSCGFAHQMYQKHYYRISLTQDQVSLLEMVCRNCLWEQLQQAKQLQPDSNNNTTKLFLEL